MTTKRLAFSLTFVSQTKRTKLSFYVLPDRMRINNSRHCVLTLYQIWQNGLAVPAQAITPEFPLQRLCNSWDCTVTKSYCLFIGTRTNGRSDNLASAFTVERSSVFSHVHTRAGLQPALSMLTISYAHTQTSSDNDNSEWDRLSEFFIWFGEGRESLQKTI